MVRPLSAALSDLGWDVPTGNDPRREVAWRAQQRIHARHRRLAERRKPPGVNNIACARELGCFLWEATTIS